jgi:hypothetical protein
MLSPVEGSLEGWLASSRLGAVVQFRETLLSGALTFHALPRFLLGPPCGASMRLFEREASPARVSNTVATPQADTIQRRALLGLTIVSVAAILAIALAHAVRASAGSGQGRPLVVARQRSDVLDALRTSDVGAVRADDPSGDGARLAVDGRDDTAWTGLAGQTKWRWAVSFARPVHLGLLRATLGASPTSGVPTVFHWETLSHAPDAPVCGVPDDAAWVALDGTSQAPPPQGEMLAQPTHRSWFVDVDTCGLSLVVDRTNAGPPVLREVRAIESARDVLRDGKASDDGALGGFEATAAVDGTYAHRWAGAAGKTRWTLRVDLEEPVAIDRVRLVLGADATSVPRAGSGRSYAIAWAPAHYTLEGSEDGARFFLLAGDALRSDGTVLPLRRRLVTLPQGKKLRAVRLVMSGATGASGLLEPGGVPVVRELSAYRADDPRPVLAAPWVLSVNANPSAQSHVTPGGEATNDAYWTSFLQRRFSLILPRMRGDDRYARSLGSRDVPLDVPALDGAGELLEAIEGDDPVLDAQLLAQSSPPPIAVLSGSDDWDYAEQTGPDPKRPRAWHWDPLHGAAGGGVGQLAPAVRQRVAPFMGFCGGAQLLALLESTEGESGSPEDDGRAIDQVLRRTSGLPIRGFAPPIDIERAWPGDASRPRAVVRFVPTDPLFADLSGPQHRSTTRSFPEWHADVVLLDAFRPGGPLERFEVLATSVFCGPDVVAASPRDGVFPDRSSPGWCHTVPEVFRSRDPAWPILGMQFHAEQKDFAVPSTGDPPESIADARLFFAAAYEEMVDAYVKLAP